MRNDDSTPLARAGLPANRLSVAVVGANGTVGRWLVALAVESGHLVTGVDLNDHPSPDLSRCDYVCADVTAPTSEAIAVFGKADWVLICVSEDSALKAIPSLLSMMKQDALWVDTLSVKTNVASCVYSCLGSHEALSINPMFAPVGPRSCGNIAVVTIRSGYLGDLFLEMLRAGGFVIRLTTADAHDRTVAVVQAATHAAILSLADVLCNMGGDIDDALLFSTPPFLAMMSLAARMTGLSPQVYWDVQAGNPHGRTARAALRDAIAQIDSAIGNGDYQAFFRTFTRIGRFLAPQQDGLSALSRSIVARMSDWNRREPARSTSNQ
jgi:prephenate dehydrogenase